MNQQTISQKYWHKLREIRRVAKEIRERKSALKREKILMNTNTSKELSEERPTTKPDNAPAGEVDLERLKDALVNVPGLPWEYYEIPGTTDGIGYIRPADFDNREIHHVGDMGWTDEQNKAIGNITVEAVNNLRPLLQQITHLTKELADAREEKRVLGEEYKRAANYGVAQHEALSSAQARIGELEGQVKAAYQKGLDASYATNERLLKDMHFYQSESQAATSVLKCVSEERNTLKASLASRDAEIARLRGAVEDSIRLINHLGGNPNFQVKALQPTNPQADEVEGGQCALPPAGWRCTRKPGHDGPCAAEPTPGKGMTI